MSRGRFITLEGIEGAGKSTLAHFAAEWLRGQGLKVRLTREPGGTPLAERLRQIVLERGPEPLSAVAETLVMFAARALHVAQVIEPALSRGEWVLCDRFTDATRAYQGGGRRVDAALIDTLARAVHPQLTPDVTFLMDLPVSVGLARAKSRAGAMTDRFEEETASFFERVRAAYLALARAEPTRFRLLDATQPLEAVERHVVEALSVLCPR
jgi:dTMP kinase